MATAVLNRHGFAEGTSVSAWPAQNSVNGGPPAGVAVATASVTGGVLTFTGLVTGVKYIAYAAGRGVQFRADEQLGVDSAPLPSPERRRIEFAEALAGSVEGGAARKPNVNFVQFVTVDGDDSHDGRSWGTAKLTWAAALAALATVTVEGESKSVGKVHVGSGLYETALGVVADSRLVSIECQPGVTLRATAAIVLLTLSNMASQAGAGIKGCPVLDMNNLATHGLRIKNCWASDSHVRVINAGVGAVAVHKTTDNAAIGCYRNRVRGQVRGTGAAGSIGYLVEGQSAGNAANHNIDDLDITNCETGHKTGPFVDVTALGDGCNLDHNTIACDHTTGRLVFSKTWEEANSTEGFIVRTGAIAEGETQYHEKTKAQGTGALRVNRAWTFGGTGSPNVDSTFSCTGNWDVTWRHETSSGAFVALLDGAETYRRHRQGWLEFPESSAPPAPATNRARIFVRDNGSGKTQVCAIFETGAIQVMATQP